MAHLIARRWVWFAAAIAAFGAGVSASPPAVVSPGADARAAAAPTEADSEVKARSLDALLEPIRAKHNLPALAGAIVKGDQVVAIGAVGTRKAGGEERVTVDDLWHIGSCTKAMTATLCAVLVEQGKLRWDTPLGEVFPRLVSMNEAYRKVTLEQLLTNRGGVPTSLDAGGLWGQLWAFRGSPVKARELLLRSFTSREPEAEPGTKFIYSNGGFSLAGHMAETVTGTPWEELIQELVFEPLGITTAACGAPGSAEAMDQPWGHRADGTPVPPGIGADNPAAISPAGRIHLSLRDWARFVSAHLRGDPANPNHSAALVSGETYRKMHTPAAGEGATGPGSDYAMGWGRPSRPWGGGHVLNHNGSNTMWFAVTWIAPKKDFAVLIACNQGGDGAAKACDEAAGALIGEAGKMK